MPRYKITTLVDITRANPNKKQIDQIKISQQSNFNSLIQCIELRSNLVWDFDPKKQEGRLPEPFKGKSTFWQWEFEVEREDVFLKDNDSVGLLLDDLNGVPIVTGLEDTSDISPACFISRGDKMNIFVNPL